MTAQPEVGVTAKWSLKPNVVTSATLLDEVSEAAGDNFGQQNGFRSYWFPSQTQLRGFVRRCAREIPEVIVSVVL